MPVGDINFVKEGTKREDGWLEFNVAHRGGVHVLQMCYASRYSSPCMIRVGETKDDLFVSVAYDTTPPIDIRSTSTTDSHISNRSEWFLDEGTFDLDVDAVATDDTNSIFITKVAFKARRQFPNIESFRFIPEPLWLQQNQSHGSRRRRSRNSSIQSSNRRLWTQFSNSSGRLARRRQLQTINAEDRSARWRKSPTAVTFTFEIGIEHEQHDDIAVMDTFLQGKPIKFVYGECHDSVSIEGSLIGDRNGGDNFPKVTFFRPDDYIGSLTMGLSTWGGQCAFTGLKLVRQKERIAPCINLSQTPTTTSTTTSRKSQTQRVQVGCRLQPPTWTYDRNTLGLNLWITSIYAQKNKPVSRYGFTLSSDTHTDFNAEEFNHFWQWFVTMKHKMMISRKENRTDTTATTTKPEQDHPTDQEGLEQRMATLKHFLLASFSGVSVTPGSNDGYLYSTGTYCNITFDVFSIHIYRLPCEEKFKSTLFVDGKQFDTARFRLPELQLTRNQILAFAIAEALQDTDLLHQMGLIRYTKSEDHASDETLELPPLRNEPPLFNGDYENTPMARRVVSILAMAGLRKVSMDTIMADPDDGWDIYCLASGSYPIFDHKDAFYLSFVAITCATLQILAPIFLIYRGIEGEVEDLTYDTYIIRFLFGVFAVCYEYKTWDIDDEERVVAWLCFLPEFSTRKLIMGMLVNKISKGIVSVGIIMVLLRSYTVLDVTLNALALYFILDVDNSLVSEAFMEKLKRYQREEFYNIRSKTSVEYRLPAFEDDEIPKLKGLPAKYFIFASHWVTDFCMAVLAIGCIFMLVEPFIFGWSA